MCLTISDENVILTDEEPNGRVGPLTQWNSMTKLSTDVPLTISDENVNLNGEEPNGRVGPLTIEQPQKGNTMPQQMLLCSVSKCC